MTPRRSQLRRTKGWRKLPAAVVVPRPTRWGNPHGGLHASAAAGCVVAGLGTGPGEEAAAAAPFST